MRADNSRHLVTAAQRRSASTRDKALRALRRLDGTGGRITVEDVAREARVSRSWLYRQDDLRAEIDRLRSRSSGDAPAVPVRQRASDSSLRQRLQTAQERIRVLSRDNEELRQQLAAVLGELRAQR